MADLNTWLFAGCGVLVSLGVGFNQLMNRRYEIHQAAFDALQEAYDALVVEHRQLTADHLTLQATLLERVIAERRGGNHGGDA